MILPDINLLVYAYVRGAPRHAAARAWWEGLLSREAPVGLTWPVIVGFVRLLTQGAVLTPPMRPVDALDLVSAWLDQPHVVLLQPGPRHLTILRQLFAEAGVAGVLTTDAHLAALAIEHQAELHSNDHDFSRFPGLRWHDPLAA